MSDLVQSVLGRKRLRESTVSADVVPVVATVPGERQARRERGQVRKKKRNQLVASILGRMSEAQDDNAEGETIFPKDAKEIDAEDAMSGPSLHGVRTVEEPAETGPDSQSDDAELLTPESALVAPDVTPMAYMPINPTKVPGVQAPSFTTGEANKEPAPGSAMDALLGQSDRPLNARTSSLVPPPQGAQRDAYDTLNISSPATMEAQAQAAVKAHAAMQPGGGMPEHRTGTGAPVMESFRRFHKPA